MTCIDLEASTARWKSADHTSLDSFFGSAGFKNKFQNVAKGWIDAPDVEEPTGSWGSDRNPSTRFLSNSTIMWLLALNEEVVAEKSRLAKDIILLASTNKTEAILKMRVSQ